MLPFYYLGALSIGYFAGYFLLVFSRERVATVWRRNPPFWRKAMFFLVRGMVWAALVAVPAGLVWKNIPKLRVSSSDLLHQFCMLTAQSLPPRGAIVMADDPPRLMAIQAALSQSGVAGKYTFLETRSLQNQGYHRYLRHKYGKNWPISGFERPRGAPVEQSALIELMTQFARTNELYYLHPSFGYYFEQFYPQPHHLVYRLERYPANTLEAPLASPEMLAENDRFWQQIRGRQLAEILKVVKKSNSKEQIESSAVWLEFCIPGPPISWGWNIRKARIWPKPPNIFPSPWTSIRKARLPISIPSLTNACAPAPPGGCLR